MAYFHCLIGGGSSGGGYELTVTCDADFAGTTITCTDGVTTLTQTCPSASPYEVVFEIPNGGEWTISGVYQGDTISTQISIPDEVSLEISHVPNGSTVTPTDDIQIWLACAEITDKSYTTLAEVLADRETFETLIADSNACDYMARSTTWANDVADDADAMALIGKYDYCSNALLDNATWASAIANSDYWDSVEQPLVPVMTSNTTPSGTVTASSAVGSSKTGDIYVPQNDYYDVFDGNDTSIVGHRGENTSDWWVAYEFSEEVLVNSFSMSAYTYNSAGTFEVHIQYLDATETWQDMGTTFTVVASNTYTFKLTSFVKAKKFRIYSPTLKTSGHALYVRTAQFYGRASSNVSNTNGIIHTANGDTVTCNGNTYVADTNGIIDIDFSQFDEGTYTFTSGIAKGPTDLSNYYSKSFKITKSPYGGTTELYLMPDTVKTLYWWGYESDELEICNTANGWTNSSWTWINPIFNSNNINLKPNGSSSSTITSGVGNSNAVSGTIAKAIAQGITALSSSYGELRTMTSKSLGDAIDYGDIQSNTMMLYDSDISQNSYITVNSTRNRSSTLYALWYE